MAAGKKGESTTLTLLDFPADVLAVMAKYLTLKEGVHLILTCSTLRERVCSADEVWMALYKKAFLCSGFRLHFRPEVDTVETPSACSVAEREEDTKAGRRWRRKRVEEKGEQSSGGEGSVKRTDEDKCESMSESETEKVENKQGKARRVLQCEWMLYFRRRLFSGFRSTYFPFGAVTTHTKAVYVGGRAVGKTVAALQAALGVYAYFYHPSLPSPPSLYNVMLSMGGGRGGVVASIVDVCGEVRRGRVDMDGANHAKVGGKMDSSRESSECMVRIGEKEGGSETFSMDSVKVGREALDDAIKTSQGGGLVVVVFFDLFRPDTLREAEAYFEQVCGGSEIDEGGRGRVKREVNDSNKQEKEKSENGGRRKNALAKIRAFFSSLLVSRRRRGGGSQQRRGRATIADERGLDSEEETTGGRVEQSRNRSSRKTRSWSEHSRGRGRGGRKKHAQSCDIPTHSRERTRLLLVGTHVEKRPFLPDVMLAATNLARRYDVCFCTLLLTEKEACVEVAKEASFHYLQLQVE